MYKRNKIDTIKQGNEGNNIQNEIKLYTDINIHML